MNVLSSGLRRTKSRVAMVAGASLLAALSGCSTPTRTATAKLPPQNLEQLQRALGAIIAKYKVPGVGVALVARNRVIWTGGVGKADLATGRAVTADTMFRIGSITKSFVALSILKLQEEGKVSLESRVADVAPEVPIVNPWAKTDPVRVADLLEHTAGFDDFLSHMSFAESFDFGGGPEERLLTVLQNFPEPQYVRWPPGTFASYSNPGYVVAGYIVEKVSGERCGDFIAANILRPLGMMHSGMRLTPYLKGELAQGYEWYPLRPVPYFPIYLRTAGAMVSSPREMARFVRMMLNRGELDGVRIVSAASIARMETPKTGLAARHGLKYGYGLANYADLSHPFIAHGHDGGIDGFLSEYEYLPGPGLGFFFSINDSESYPAFRDIKNLLYEFLTRGLKPPAAPGGIPLDSRIAPLAGYYEVASPRDQSLAFVQLLLGGEWIYSSHGELYRSSLLPGSGRKLVYLGDGLVRNVRDQAASAVFFKDRRGRALECKSLECLRRTGALWPTVRLALTAAALAVMVSSMVFALVWIPRKLAGRMKGAEHLSARVVALLAVLAFASFAYAGYGAPLISLARPTARSVTLFASSIAFAILSAAALLLGAGSISSRTNLAARIHTVLVAIACSGIAGYMAYWGLIGVRTWARH